MKHRLDVAPEVVSQILSRSAEYEGAQEGLGQKFEGELESLLESICDHPQLYQREYGDIRCAFIPRFKKVLYYIVRGDAVVLIEVRDARQEPPDWGARGFNRN